MAYDFRQMLQKKGVQGQPGGKPAPNIMPPQAQEVKGGGVTPDGGPSYSPPVPAPEPAPGPYPPGGGRPPAPAAGGKPNLYLGPPVPGGPNPGAGGLKPQGSGRPYPYPQPPEAGGMRMGPPNPGSGWGVLPGGGRAPSTMPQAPTPRASPMTMPDGTTAYIWNGRAYPYDPSDPANAGIPDPYGTAPNTWQGGAAPVPGGGRVPYNGGVGVPAGGYMPYFNPNGGIRYDPNNPGNSGSMY